MAPREQRWNPTKCGAPPIDSLSDDLVSEYILRVIFHSASPTEDKIRALVIGYIRLVDKCTAEYRNGRSSLSEFVSSETGSRINILLRAASHFETCIGSMKRAVDYLDALRRIRTGPGISKNLGILREAKRIRTIRDAIEHTDDDIRKGVLLPGDAHVLLVQDNGLTLGGEEISYRELKRWLGQLHEQARKIWEHYSQ